MTAYKHRVTVRGALYASLGLSVVGEIALNDDTSWARIAISLGVLLALIVAAEFLIGFGKPKGRTLFNGSQTALVRSQSVPSFEEMIDGSDQVWLLGGTFKTFTDDSQNLDALARFFNRRPQGLQILMMHPDGGGLESTARARQARGKGDTVATLRAEVIQSLNRLVEALGPKCVRQIFVYKEHPTYAMYKFGSEWILTVYTLGRGASSPAMYFKEGEANGEFCRGLERGFDDVRDAESTERVEMLPRDERGFFIIP